MTKLSILSCVGVLSVVILASGCSSTRLGAARENYYRGDFVQAAEALTEIPDEDKNEVLALMERGMIRHTTGDYKAANADWLEANEVISELDYFSVSEGASSLVINDTTQTYSGAPFERSLLHAFTAKNYLALAQWHDAAVESRLIADGLEALNKFPDDPYSRYVSGLGFELIRDSSGAALEYRKANALTKHLSIDERTGRITPATTNLSSVAKAPRPAAELICLVGLGRAPTPERRPRSNAAWGNRPYVEILHNGRTLGRSYTLNTTGRLLAETQKRIAAIKAAKTVTRIVLKESIASAVSEQNAFLGEILRLILYAIEAPDSRSWETLPMWLQVARVPCPKELDRYTVVFRNTAGKEIKREIVTSPITNRDSKYVSCIRAW